MGSFYDGLDIFVAMYLKNRPQFDASPMHHTAEQLLESIERAEKNWPFKTDDGDETE